VITTQEGEQILFNIPVDLMRVNSEHQRSKNYLDPWHWVETTYDLALPGNIQSIQIDPRSVLGDIDRANNSWPREK
jgi:hypothetical protein